MSAVERAAQTYPLRDGDMCTTTWGTWTRPRGTQYGVKNVRCAVHSVFDLDGFAVQGADDPAGDRCTAPVVGAPCEVCGVQT